ncbi:MAG: hypothetical protein WD341_05170 [Tistlia sp.]|uniref:hypothetical protein n=1 Tax=Tistlia sp. TaxID=3057121 RepID=UPI0034A2AF48
MTFRRPFRLTGFGEPLAAGSYCVEVEEERIEGLSFAAYGRVLTVLRLPPGTPGGGGALTADPAELEAALARDQEGARPGEAQEEG